MGSIAIDHVSTVNCQNTVCQLSVYTLSCGSFAAVTETHFERDKIMSRAAAAPLLAAFGTSDGFAHSGGLCANGCHAGSKPYHCIYG